MTGGVRSYTPGCNWRVYLSFLNIHQHTIPQKEEKGRCKGKEERKDEGGGEEKGEEAYMTCIEVKGKEVCIL